MHAEALITQLEFSRKYKEFFLKDLLESKVLSPKETLAAFDELIEIAKDAYTSWWANEDVADSFL